MHRELEDIINKFDELFYAMRDIADPSRRDEREAIEDKFDAFYAEAMRLAGRTQY